ncbi:MAG: cobalamin-dependent protein, partial [bacterium]
MDEKTKVMLVNLVYEDQYPPLSIACLTAYATKFEEIREKCKIILLSAPIESFKPKALAGFILSHNPAIIGFSCYLWNLDIYIETIPAIREKLKDSLILLGGPESYPELLLEIPGADAVVVGEGELAFKELLEKRTAGLPWEDIRGIALRRGGGVHVNPPQPLIENLDDIPSPYLTGIIQAGNVKRIEYNRGCTYKCSFCYWSNTHYRHYSLKRIEEEIRDCIANKRPIHFQVGSYLNSGEFGVQILRFVKKCRLEHNLIMTGIILVNGNRYDPEFFEALAEAVTDKKLAVVEFGVQCCDRETMKLNSRINNLRAIKKNTALLNRLKISSMIDILLGMPGDNLLRVAQSLATVTDFRPTYIPIALLRQIPNTAIFRESEKFGIEADRLPPRIVHKTISSGPDALRKTAIMAQSFSIEYHAANRFP